MDVNESTESTSSDSDSDYFPENITKSRGREHGRKKSTTIGIKKAKHEIICSNQRPSTTSALPLELLVMIFQYIVEQFGPFLTLKKYGLVCKQWRLALLENTLWQSVSLNCKESWLNINQALKWLCKFKQNNVKQLTVSSWRRSLNNTSFQQLLQICHQVKCVELNNCVLNFDELFKCLDQLEKLTIAQCNVRSFDMLVQTCNDTLHYLSLIEVGSSLCHSLSKCDTPLVKLRTLQLDNFSYFRRTDSINLLQKMCPNLIHLQLAFVHNAISRDFQSEVGLNRFLSLKYLELTFQMFSNSSCDLYLLLSASPNLQSLTLVHYTQACTVNYDKLVSVMSSSLTEFALFYCKLDFIELMSKLLHRCDAMQRLTIASPKGQRVTDDIITTIVASPCVNTLQYLDLSGTDVTITGIRILLNSVSNLAHLDLLRCRYLPRGTKRIYNNAFELNKLL